jgi:hypothetical protein
MICFLLLALRHGVMQNASDDLHMPVIVFGVGSVLVSLAIGARATTPTAGPSPRPCCSILAPLSVFSPTSPRSPFDADWKLAPLSDFIKPDVIKACIASLGALIVLTAIATAASTRVGQVMTIMICLGVFILGLLGDYFIGRHAFKNEPVGVIEGTIAAEPGMESFAQVGDEYAIVLRIAHRRAGGTGRPLLLRPRRPTGWA